MSPRLWAITDASLSDDELAARVTLACVAACAAGTDALCIHLRDKVRSAEALRPIATRLREITRAYGAWLAVGDHPSLADEVGADVAHGWMGRGARAVWSVPAHADDDVRRALAVGANVVLVSPIFATPGKGTPRGIAAIASARSLASGLSLYALGGVDASNARACVDAGADGVAVIRAVLGDEDTGRAVRAMFAAMQTV